jgi:hypothetical protein
LYVEVGYAVRALVRCWWGKLKGGDGHLGEGEVDGGGEEGGAESDAYFDGIVSHVIQSRF